MYMCLCRNGVAAWKPHFQISEKFNYFHSIFGAKETMFFSLLFILHSYHNIISCHITSIKIQNIPSLVLEKQN